jgi:hypothetical protein
MSSGKEKKTGVLNMGNNLSNFFSSLGNVPMPQVNIPRIEPRLSKEDSLVQELASKQ